MDVVSWIVDLSQFGTITKRVELSHLYGRMHLMLIPSACSKELRRKIRMRKFVWMAVVVVALVVVISYSHFPVAHASSAPIINADGKVLTSVFEGVPSTPWGKQVAAGTLPDSRLGQPNCRKATSSKLDVRTLKPIAYQGCCCDYPCQGTYMVGYNAVACGGECPTTATAPDHANGCPYSGGDQQVFLCTLGATETSCCQSSSVCQGC